MFLRVTIRRVVTQHTTYKGAADDKVNEHKPPTPAVVNSMVVHSIEKIDDGSRILFLGPQGAYCWEVVEEFDDLAMRLVPTARLQDDVAAE